MTEITETQQRLLQVMREYILDRAPPASARTVPPRPFRVLRHS